MGLAWFALTAGAAGVLCGAGVLLLASGRPVERTPESIEFDRAIRRWMFSGAAVILVGAALAWFIPKSPFSHTWIYGWLLGGLAGAGGFWLLTQTVLLARAPDPSPTTRALAPTMVGAVIGGLAVATAAVLVLLFPAGGPDAALGLALGCAAFGLATLAGHSRSGALQWEFTGIYLLLVIGLAIATILSAAHFTNLSPAWRALPAALGGVAVLAALVGGIATMRLESVSGARLVATAAATALLSAGLSLLLFRQGGETLPAFIAFAVGAAVGVLVVWARVSQLSSAGSALFGLAALVALLIGFRLLAGYGAALTGIGLWAALLPVAGTLLERRGNTAAPGAYTLLLAFGMMTAFLVFRLLLERVGGRVPGLDLGYHYEFTGLLVGALLPVTLSRALYGQRSVLGSRLALAVTLGIVLAPPSLMILWGARTGVGLAAGLVIGVAALVAALPEDEGVQTAPLVFTAVVTGLVTLSVSDLLQPLYDLPRVDKVYIAVGLGLLFVLWLALLSSRRRAPEVF